MFGRAKEKPKYKCINGKKVLVATQTKKEQRFNRKKLNDFSKIFTKAGIENKVKKKLNDFSKIFTKGGVESKVKKTINEFVKGGSEQEQGKDTVKQDEVDDECVGEQSDVPKKAELTPKVSPSPMPTTSQSSMPITSQSSMPTRSPAPISTMSPSPQPIMQVAVDNSKKKFRRRKK